MRTTQLRVVLVDPESAGATPAKAAAQQSPPRVLVPQASPLAVRPVEDPEWFMLN